MNKILIAFVVVVVVICVAVGLNIVPYFDFYAPDDISEYTDLFNYSSQPVIDWNENTHEFKFYQDVSSVDNQDFENLSIDLLFYNHGSLMKIESNDIDKTVNGTFDLNFTTKLDSHPDAIYYNVTNLDWA